MSNYSVLDGSKLHLMLKAKEGSSEAAQRASSSGSSKKSSPKKTIDEVLFSALRKHFRTEEETKLVLVAFKKVR